MSEWRRPVGSIYVGVDLQPFRCKRIYSEWNACGWLLEAWHGAAAACGPSMGGESARAGSGLARATGEINGMWMGAAVPALGELKNERCGGYRVLLRISFFSSPYAHQQAVVW